MSNNKRRHGNAVPIASFASWAVIGVFVCICLLGYVWCKNELHTTGSKIKSLERELSALKTKNEEARAHISQHSSTKALQDRFDSGFIKLKKITDEQLIAIPRQPTGTAENELRPVSNERSRK